MRWLFRQEFLSGADAIEYRDKEIITNTVTVGKNADQDINLADSDIGGRHAELRKLPDGRLQVKAISPFEVIFNDTAVFNCNLQINESIEVGNYRITHIDGPMGFDAALVLARTEGSNREGGKLPYDTELKDTGSKKRLYSWILFLGILIFGLLIPFAGLMDKELMKNLRSWPGIPSDNAWLSGPLIRAHQIPEIGHNCNKCHLNAFERVTNKACLDCHKMTNAHVQEKKFVEINQWRCEKCHKEHNEPEMIVRNDQALCASCHDDKQKIPDNLQTVSDFGSEHPEFRYSLLRLVDEIQPNQKSQLWKTIRVEKGKPEFTESSNLKNDHKVHLDKEGVDSPTGVKVMKCEDCHELNDKKDVMKPVNMEKHCAECHVLVFDEDQPDRVLPHGKPSEIRVLLEEFYSKAVLSGSLKNNQSKKRREVRRPGHTENVRKIGNTFAWAKQQAKITEQIIFTKSICNVCHTVKRVGGNEPGSSEISDSEWHVAPVVVNQDWLPKSYFSHKSHLTEKCKTCHNAYNSEKSEDVLMPDVKVCHECHGGGKSSDKISSDCYMCHKFHIPYNITLSSVNGSDIKDTSKAVDNSKVK